MPAFLLEIGLEEVPAGMVNAAQAELAKRLRALLTRERLATEKLELKGFSTPRRLAVLAEGLHPEQADREEQVTGPSVAVAYRNGAPTPAATAFAKKSGVDVSALTTIQTAKGEYVAAAVSRPGRTAAEVLTAEVPAEIAGIYWPKNMYWRAGKPERFVRPVRWLLALLDREILPLEFAGVAAAGVSYGHRVLHGPAPVVVVSPHGYAKALRSAFVDVEFDARRRRIRVDLNKKAERISARDWRQDEDLLETVTNLTEWPSVILGSFDTSYLELPEEVLVTVMRDHQKYFALEYPNGKLMPNFLTVLNIEVDAAGEETIRHGNERVLRARFNDARFFWEQDQKIPLEQRVEMLKHVTFQKDLGSYWDKTQAVVGIAAGLAETLERNAQLISPSGKPFLDRTALLRAAELAKTDLTTELVKEFTELQGVVGGFYARAQGLGETVAAAISSQYIPASISDKVPRTDEGRVLGLADRIHTIAAMFQLGLEPTGSKDPFALRRAGNAVAKIMATHISAVLTLTELIETAVSVVSTENQELTTRLRSFLQERISYYLEEGEQLPADCVKAAMTAGCEDVRDVFDRATAFRQMYGSADFLAVCAQFKRIRNILEQAKKNDEQIRAKPAPAFFTEQAEKDLYVKCFVILPSNEKGYVAILQRIANLRPTVDNFFDHVMVMVPDVSLRQNRLALLQFVFSDFTRIGDFSQIAVEPA